MRFFTHSARLFDVKPVKSGLKLFGLLLPLCLLVAGPGSAFGQIVVSHSSTSVTCPSNSDDFSGDGSINLSVTGGVAPYSFLWGDGVTTEDRNGLESGDYVVTVSDATSPTPLSSTYTVTIAAPADWDVEDQTSYFGQDTLATFVFPFRVSCFGASDGFFYLTPTGGTLPYSYIWSNGATVEDISGLTGRPRSLGGKGYSWSIIDNNECYFTAGHTKFYTPEETSTTLSTTNVTCFGGSNGAASITINNIGALGVNYYSSPTPLSSLSAGSYTLTATTQYWDSLGTSRTCAKKVVANITQPAEMIISGTAYPETCLNDGYIDISVTGNTAPYSYLWSQGSTTQDISSLAPGTYYVTVKDLNNCSLSEDFEVISTTPLLSGVVQNVNCFGQTNGGVDLTVTGGATPYYYTWTGGANTPDLSNVGAGEYSVTVTFNGSCPKMASFTITEPDQLAVNASVVNATCFGFPDGSINLTVNGGTAPYSFFWSNSSTEEDRTGLTSENYTVSVTDAHGCLVSDVWFVDQPDAIDISGVVTSVSCFAGSNGEIDITVTGGNPGGYSYFWDLPSTTEDLIGLSAGAYAVTVSDLAHNCVGAALYFVTEPDELSLNLTPTHVLCNGDFTGSVSSSVNGGTPGYFYLWSTGATTESITNQPVGTYSLVVTDAMSCKITESVTINQPSAVSYTVTSLGVTCNGLGNGNIVLEVTGGTPDYFFEYAGPSSGNNTFSVGPIIISNLDGGSFSYTLTDANGCKFTGSVMVDEPAPLQIASALVTDVNCKGGSDGSIDITVTGGFYPSGYDFSWGLAHSMEDVLDFDYTDVPAGVYSVTVTDGNDCQVMGTYTVNEPVADLSIASGFVTPVTCFGYDDGTISLSINGGTAPYSYVWFPAVGNSENLTNLAGGVYQVTVTDATGVCVTFGSYTVNAPSQMLSVLADPTSVLCHGESNGTITLSVSGGTIPYTYNWGSIGSTTSIVTGLAFGNYDYTVTDLYLCSVSGTVLVDQYAELVISNAIVSNVNCKGGSDGGVDITVEGGFYPSGYDFSWGLAHSMEDVMDYDYTDVPAGVYSVTVTDGNDCQVTGTYTVIEPAADLVIASAVVTPVTCFGANDGTIALTVNGGTGPYSYVWDPAVGNSETLSNLAGGVYQVTVTDATGVCMTFGSYTVNAPSQMLTVLADPTSVLCHGESNGTITLNVAGGTVPYTYNWGALGSTTSIVTGLAYGNYDYTVTDLYLCSVSGTVLVDQYAELVISNAIVSNVNCKGGSDGAIDITVQGGFYPSGYDFSWGLAHSMEDVLDFDYTNVPAGVYSVTVTDGNDCQVTGTYTVNEPAADLAISSNVVTPVTCFGANDGTISLTVVGGTGPYTFVWDPAVGNSESLTNLGGGVYQVTVTDATGVCTTYGSYTVNAPTQVLSVVSNPTSVLCYGEATGTITLDVTGGTAPYSYNWGALGNTTSVVTGLSSGTYYYTVTDLYLCSVAGSVFVDQYPQLNISNAIVTNVNCKGGSDGSIDITVQGGFFPSGYDFSWGLAHSAEDVLDFDYLLIPAGVYSVTVTDGNDCQVSASYTIIEPAADLTIASSIVTPVSCFGFDNGAIQLTVGGGTAPYTYVWDPNVGATENLSNLPGGVYQVTVIDATNVCTTIGSYTVSAPSQVLTVTADPTSVLCYGESNGTITLSVNGGTPGYTFNWGALGNTTSVVTGLASGTYYYTVTDLFLCSVSNSVFVDQYPELVISNSIVTDVNCKGGSDGAIDITVQGGFFPSGYDFSWGLAHSAEDVLDFDYLNIPAGVYSVSVTDGNDCQVTGSYTVNEPAADLTILAGTVTPVSCFGADDGSISIQVSGGTGPYTYNWLPNAGNSETISSLAGGIYEVTVTDATNVCTVAGSYTVIAPSSPLSASYTATKVSCFGGNDGAIDLEVSGGMPGLGYSVVWSVAPFNAEDLTNLSEGTYYYTVTDAHFCLITGSVYVGQEDKIVASILATDLLCNNDNSGQLTVTTVGGVAPYTFVWGHGVTTASNTLLGLAAGTYYLTVFDSNGCPMTNNVGAIPSSWDVTPTDKSHIILFNTSDALALQLQPGDYVGAFYTNLLLEEKCAGYSVWNGSSNIGVIAWGNDTLTVDKDGFYAGDEITWKVFRPFVGEFGAVASYAPIDGIDIFDGGFYHGNGQSGVNAFGYTPSLSSVSQGVVEITEPSPISVTHIAGNVTCFGGADGTVSLTVSGGTPGMAPNQYSYSWYKNTIPYGGNTSSLFGLSADFYSVDVEDANGCIGAEIFEIEGPAAGISFLPTIVDVNCFGASTGAVSVSSISGGWGGYSFAWSNGATTMGINGLNAGNYSLTISDVSGCEVVESFVVVNLNNPLQINSTVLNSCFNNSPANGSISLSVSGGDGNYSYLWFNSATTSSVNGLGSGSYNVTVLDGLGCFLTETFAVGMGSQIVINGSTTDLLCAGNFNGGIDLSVSGGLAPYSFIWHTGSVAEDLMGLEGGNYYVTVTDSNGCKAFSNFDVNEPQVITLNAGIINASCNGYNGAIDLTVLGGTAPFTYFWQSLIGMTYTNIGTTQDITGLTNGIYNVTVTDGNGCIANGTFTVAAPGPYSVLANISDVVCHNGSDGVINLTWAGGFSPYTVHWYKLASVYTPIFTQTGISSGSTTLSGLGAGIYKAVVVDVNFCGTFAADLIVDQPDMFDISQVAHDYNGYGVSCFGSQDGIIDVNNMIGGTPPYTVYWYGNPLYWNELTIAGLEPGFSIEGMVTDAHGCSYYDLFEVGGEPAVLQNSYDFAPILCFGNSTNVNFTTSGGVPPYTVTGDSNPVFAGVHNFVVSDANLCSVNSSMTITQPDEMFVGASLITPISCFGGEATVEVTAAGGTPGYSGTGLFNVLAGEHSFIVVDALGCQKIASITVTQPTLLVASSTYTSIACNGGSSTVTVTANGGTAPYIGVGDYPVFAGSYSYTVTDNNGCQTITDGFIDEPALPVSAQSSFTDINCFGGTSVVTVTANGGTGTLYGIGSYTVSAGAYSYTVTDDNGCFDVTSVSITEPTLLEAFSIHTAILCNGGTSTVSVSATGGTGAYLGIGDFVVVAGPYSFDVLDDNGCVATTSGSISQPDLLVASSTFTTISCFGDNSTITVSGVGGTGTLVGTGVFIVPAGPYSYTVSDDNGCTSVTDGFISQPTAPVEAFSTFTPINCFGESSLVEVTATGGTGIIAGIGSFNLPAGEYSYTVTDENGCSDITALTITEPTLLEAFSTYSDILCKGGSSTVTVTATGGTGPYNGIGEFEVFVGPYTFTVVDANGCTTSTSGNISEPDLLVVSSTYTSISCFGETSTVTVSAFGGTGAIVGTGDFVVNAGPYSFTVTDANGCSAVTQGNISQPAAPLVAHSTYTTISCFGDNSVIEVTAEGGTGIYSGIGSYTVTAGGYSYTVIDENGCSDITSGTISQPDLLEASSVSTLIACHGEFATVSVYAVGGVLPYAGIGDYSVPAGNYSYTVTDVNGCSSITNILVSEPDMLGITATAPANVCVNETFDVNLSYGGGAGGFTVTGSPLTNLLAGTYSYTVTDGNGCWISTDVTVGNFVTPEISFLDLTSSTGGISGNLGSGFNLCLEPSVPFILLGVNTSTVNTSLSDGYYPFYVGTYPSSFMPYWNAKGVNAGATPGTWQAQMYQIITANAPIFYLKSQSNVLTLVDGLQYQMGGGDQALRITGDYPAGMYVFGGEVMSSDNCPSQSIVVNFQMNSKPSASISADYSTVCDLVNTVTLTVDFSEGTGPYSFIWNDGNANSVNNVSDPYSFVINPLINTTVTLSSITDSYGCSNSDLGSVAITVLECHSIEGYVKYNNALNTPLSGVNVTIKSTPGDVEYGTLVTGTDGKYSFQNIPVGNYYFSMSTAKTILGAINATDALNVVLYSPTTLIEKIGFLAGDVNAAGGVNSTDAVNILNRTTNSSWIFARGNWVFTKAGVQLNNFTLPHTVDLSISLTSDLVQDIYGQVVGDFNRSFVPPVENLAKNDELSNVILVQNGSVNHQAESTFEIPLALNRDAQIGAITLYLNYPDNLVRIDDVTVVGSDVRPVYRIEGNELRIAWYDLNGISVQKDAPVIMIRMKGLSGFDSSDEVKFDLDRISFNELAEPNGTVIEDAVLVFKSIVFNEIASVGNDVFAVSAYPNPFSEVTTIGYELAGNGYVKMEVLNPLGEVIAILVDQEMNSGKYSVNFDGRNYPSGVYTCKLSARVSGAEVTQNTRMIITH